MPKVQKHHVKARAARINARLHPTCGRMLHHGGRHGAHLDAIGAHKAVRSHGVVHGARILTRMRKLDTCRRTTRARHAGAGHR